MNYFDFYKHTLELLKDGRLLDALNAIQSEALNTGTNSSATIVASCAEALNTYRSLLTYFEKGVEDKGRGCVYADLVKQALVLNEQLKRVKGLKESQSTYYSKLRSHLRLPRTLNFFLNRIEQQRANIIVGDIFRESGLSDEISDANSSNKSISALQSALFDRIWITDIFSTEELAILSRYFGLEASGSNTSDAEAVWMVSALTLSVLFYFDLGKWNLLKALVNSENVRIRVRAKVGCALVVMNHGLLLSVLEETQLLDSEDNADNDKKGITHDVDSIADNVDKATIDNCNMQWQFLVQYKTKFVHTAVNDALNSIFHQMNKGMTEEQLQNMLESEDDDLPDGVDINLIHHLRDEIARTTNMTVEGIDTAYPQFSRLRNLPFYNEVSNWLRPFDAADEADMESARKFAPILINTHICNSDAYAFLQAITRVPAGMRDYVDSQLKMLGNSDVSLSEMMKNRDEKELTKLYIRDIYRLFTLKTNNQPEGNPLIACPLMLFVNKTDESNRNALANLCARAFNHRLYRHAVPLFGILEQYSQEQEQIGAVFPFHSLSQEEETMYAVSLAFTGNNDDAIIHFETAGPDNLNDSASSVYAHCLWSEGLQEDALKVYRKLYIASWQGLNLFDLGTKLYDVARYTEAATVLYKAQYLEPSRPDIMHLLMLSLLRDRRPEEAQNMCAKLLAADISIEPQSSEWLKNAAICLLCCGNQTDAIASLRRAHRQFSEEEIAFLSSYDISQNTIHLIVDAANI